MQLWLWEVAVAMDTVVPLEPPSIKILPPGSVEAIVTPTRLSGLRRREVMEFVRNQRCHRQLRQLCLVLPARCPPFFTVIMLRSTLNRYAVVSSSLT